MGHGMGGALVLNYVCGLGRRISSLAGIMVSAPYLKPAISGAGTRFPSTYNRLGKWYPNISVNFQVSPEELTRDHAEQERHHGDGLIRDSVSLRCCKPWKAMFASSYRYSRLNAWLFMRDMV